MPFVGDTGQRVYWKLEGADDAPAIVLLPSIGTDMDLWEPLVPALRRDFRLLRVDTRGHGASDAPPRDYTLAQLAADIVSAMDAAGINRAAIAGVSLGGMIAMQLALDVRERVSALALICTSANMDRAAWKARVETVRADGMAGIADLAMQRFLSPAFIADEPEIAATVRRGLLGTDPDGYAGCAAAIRDMALEDRLADIDVPTLVVTGLRDASTPFGGHGEHLIARIARSAHLELDCAHLAPLNAPGPLAEALATFLTDPEPA